VLTYSSSETFHRQRRFADSINTRNVNNKFYGYIGLEMKKFMHDIVARPHDLHDLTHLFCARISSRLAYGHVDSAAEHVTNAGTFISQLGPSGPHTNLLPFLQQLPAWMVPGQTGVVRRQEKEAKLWQELYDRTKEAHKDGAHPKTYVSASIEARESGEAGKPLFANEAEWQDKVRKEIDEIVGEDDMLDLKHSPLLPTLRAAIKESVRWKSTVPLGK
jgi:hypothetical protein